MPSTLIHLGVQGFACRTLVRDIDLRFVYLACVIPDVPWILQRVIHALPLPIDHGELMLRSGAQSSLFFSLILCAAIAILCRRSASVFAILASGALLHLLLDITQIKWGRGAIFLAPLDWRTVSLDWLWPDNPLFHALAFLSLGFVLITWRTLDHSRVIRPAAPLRSIFCAAALIFYLLAPGLFSSQLLAQDVYFAKTLSDHQARAGSFIAFDRAKIVSANDEVTLVELFTGEVVGVQGMPPGAGKRVSVEGHFRDSSTIIAAQHHFHDPMSRVTGSLIGLLLVCVIWGQSIWRWWREPELTHPRGE
jgi:hypothetical protein